MFRTTRSFLTLFLLLISSLAVGLQAQTAPVVTVCQLSDFTAGSSGHAVYLFSFPGAVSPRYRWDTNGGTFTIYADSSARVTGTVINDSFPNWQWEVDYWFIDQRDFTSWDALGRDVKIEDAPANLVNTNKQDWLFWEFDSTRSRMLGVPGTQFDGDTLFISHNPPNREFGLQYGIAANSKDGDFGMSGWFKHSGAYTGHGDINVDASCGSAPCDVDITSASPSCLTDSTFTATVTFTGTGGPFILNDDKGSAPLVVNTAGTYQYGSYPNGDTVMVFVSDSLAVGCADTSSAISTDCTPAPVCDVAISSAVPACVTDSTFDVTVTIAGTGSYTLTDDQGITNLSGLTAGTYVVGPYVSNTVVALYAADAVIANCADTVSNVTSDCTPAPVCDVAISSAVPACVTDSTFDVTVTIAGTGSYTLTDDQGITNLSGLTAGTYVVGPYVSNTMVELYAADAVIANCADTVSNVTSDCTPAPVCDVAISSAVPACVTDSTFDVTVTIAGTGSYTLTDDQGITNLSGLTAGTYVVGPYVSNTMVELYAADAVIANCADTVSNVTSDCTPAPVCDVAISSAVPACATDSTFNVTVTITGTGSYTLTDDQGITNLSGLTAGTYVVGPYVSNTMVELYAADAVIANCADTVSNVTSDCTPAPVCAVAIDSVAATCASDSTFEIQISFSGTGPFTLSDNQGTAPMTGLAGGTYAFGSYSSNDLVTIFLEDPAFVGCVDSVAALTQNCIPVVPVCEVGIDTLYASCATDTSFTIFVEISGSGNTYQISDDQGTTPISGLTAGMYNFGNYFNSTNVLLTVTDLSLAGCDTTVGPVTADCTPVAVCDLVLDSVYTTCLTDSTFDVTINLLGSGQFYQVFDNQGSMPFFPVGAGTYTFGPFAEGTQVTITASDLAIFNCFVVAGPLTASCGPEETNSEVNLWAVGEDEEIQVGWDVVNLNLSTGFFLERTMDPELEASWETVMWFPSTSASSTNPSIFDFTDQDVLPSITYSYRVKAISVVSGEETYSNVASAIIARTSGLWIGDFFPNPTTGPQISFGMSTPETGGIKWILYDMTGSKRGEGLIKSQKGEKIYLIEFDNLTTGVYSIQVWYEGQFIRTKKIIVTN